VKLYRSDTGDLYAETTADASGNYSIENLPFFDYDILVRAYHHVPVSMTITINGPTLTQNFMLDPTNGDILVIDAGAGREFAADKFDEKGNLIASGYQVPENRSTTDMIADLEFAGYSATLADMTSDPAEWVLYDMLIVAGGASTDPISDSAFQSALTSFAAAGGHYIVEGGEIAYVHNGAGFGADVLHIQSWTGDSSGSVTVADAAHYVMSVPNVITGPITVSYAGYGDQDSATPTADAAMVGGWTEGSSASVITYDSNPAPQGGQYVGFMFNYSAMDAAVRGQLLQNAVNWLLALETGNCSVSGTVTLQGETNHAGITVEALPGGGSTVTAADGSYSFPGLYAGSYSIRASKQLWSVGSVDVTLEDGQNMTGVDMLLTPVQEMADCSQPALAIPDNDPAGVSDIMNLSLPQATVANVEVYVDVTHTWQGDLLVNLTSPEGTTVVLHNRTGGSDDNILGWYPTELTPAGDLGLFAGEMLSGDWTLFISDNAGADTGTLNEWCLNIEYGGGGPAPALELSTGAVAITLAPDATGSEVVTMTNTVPESVLDYTVQILPTVPMANRSIAGSTLTPDLTEYLPGTTADLVLTVYNASTDAEWLKDIFVTFPAGVTVNSASNFVGGSEDAVWDGTTGEDVIVNWHGETSSGWGVIHGDETAVATINVTFGGGGDLVFDFQLDGDIYGADPHTINDSFTIIGGSSDPFISVSAPNGGEVLWVGDIATISWNGMDYGLVDVELSRDNGASWSSLATAISGESYDWTVTGPVSADCLVRLSDDTGLTDTSEAVFTISQPLTWVTATPVAGSINGGDSSDLELAFDTTSMASDTYTAFVVITHNGSTAQDVIELTLTVSGGGTALVVPTSYELKNNYPNPFNPSTTIEFALPQPGNVSLVVYDIAGRVVNTLVSGNMEAANHSVVWDGRDTGGRQVSSGVYYYRLISDSFKDTRKMMLVK